MVSGYSIVVLAAAAMGVRQALGSCGFDSVEVTTSPGFTVTTSDDYKVVTDTTANTTYGMYCDSQPTGVSGVDKWFKVPVASVGIREVAASGFLEMLGKSKTIVAAEDPANLTNPCMDSNVATLDNSTSSSVSVVFSSDANSDGDLSVRVPSDDSLTPLQKAEWIKFIATFFNAETTATTLFSGISTAYECHRSNLQHLASPPHAYWVQYTASDAAYDNKPTYNIVDTAYQKELLAAAGATNDTKTALTDPTDQAAFQSAVADADYVVDQTNLTDYGMRASEWYADFGYTGAQNTGAPFLQQRALWRTDGYASSQGVSNFPEFAYARPDLVLQDIISVVEPTYNASYSRRWVLWLGGTAESAVTISSANYNCDAPWMAQVASCSARSDFTGTADSASSSDASNSGGSGSSHGRAAKIAGGVVGAVALVGLAIVAMHYINRHRRRTRIRALSGTSGYGGESIGLHDTRPRVYS
ncbi:hypothetical protein EV175_002309 [Coemansia sp. RSA 1933]|nr:hypothetical protein EV175_002309 [Coemansia sp. RSA 1933]